MSELSELAKDRLEPIIRRDEPMDFAYADNLMITSFAFLKSAVLDWSATDRGRKPLLSRPICLRFRESLTSLPPNGVYDVTLPAGLQVWIARYRRTHRMEAQAFSEEMTGVRHLKGYKVLIVTYVVGSFIFQLTWPRWTKATRNRPPAPFFEILGDDFAVPIWPGVSVSYWPPFAHIDSRSLEAFRERFRRVRI